MKLESIPHADHNTARVAKSDDQPFIICRNVEGLGPWERPQDRCATLLVSKQHLGYQQIP